MGIPTLISTDTASNDSAISITSGIDSTYDEYMFVFTDINPATDERSLTFQFNAAGGSGYNETLTTTYFQSLHHESDAATNFLYENESDQAQATGFQRTAFAMGNGADESMAGILHLFSPSSTTYVKHFYYRGGVKTNTPSSRDVFVAGYINTTSAIDEIQFKMDSGNFDGVIQMYGIS